MSDLVQTLVGGSNQSSRQTPTDMSAPEFAGLRGGLASTLQQLFQSGGGPGYQGPLAAPMQENEPGALQATNQSALDPTRQNLIQKTQQGNFLPGQPGANPFFDAAVQAAQRPTLQGLTETLSRALPGRFTAAGHLTTPHGSSAFDRAAGIATRGASQAVGDIATNMGNQQYGQERQLQQGAVSLGQNDVQTLINNLTAQGLPRNIEQTGIQNGITAFNQRLQALMTALQTSAGVAAPVIANSGQSQGDSSTGILPSAARIIAPR